MSKIVWDDTGKRLYETGVDRCLVYSGPNSYGEWTSAEPWNGILSITESPSGAELTKSYADNTKYLNLMSAEEHEFTVETYTIPFLLQRLTGGYDCLYDGGSVLLGQQPIRRRNLFGMSYRTLIGNDVAGNNCGYKLHLVYGCSLVGGVERAYTAINDSPEINPYSLKITTTPIVVSGYKPISHVVIDSRKFDSSLLNFIENQHMYENGSMLPPETLVRLIESTA